MIDRWESLLHRWRHRLSRSAWLVRLLGMSISRAAPERRGLLLVQIDGLAKRHLEAALAQGRMPFARRLLEREHYRLRTMYAGVPSTTPSVQGELFYGVRQSVPAFGFRDFESGEQVEMFAASVARRKQTALEGETDQPLLRGGSAYCNIYTGGAAEPHYCAASLGWGQLTDGVRPWTWLLIALLYTPEILLACALLVLELAVALGDAVRGAISRRHPLQELEYVLRRVAVCVVLRELMTIAATLDVARGLPVVEVNFLGYDEQAHHRGPDARYAHWSLGGIDRAMARIWKSAAGTPHREYDLWIYSDHGQERVMSYTDQHGRSIQDAVGEIFRRRAGGVSRSPDERVPARRGIASAGSTRRAARASYLRRSKALEALRGNGLHADEVEVVAVGPLGFVYYRRELPHDQWQEIAAAVVDEARVPLVLLAEEDGHAQAWAPGRHGYLPEDAALFLGREHPFLDRAAEDLVRLAHHRDAGNLVIGGWADGEQPLTYVMERGAHAGCGPDELSAFALLPPHAPLREESEEIERPLELRQAALRMLSGDAPRHQRKGDRAISTMRVMTYNIHSCMGMDGRVSPERVARVIAATGADVIALQEVDVGRRRTGYLDQAQRIAEQLGMHAHFHRTFEVAEEKYGHAVLSRWPLRVVRSGPLPTLLPKRLEPRGALWVELEVDGQAVQVVSTHLGLVRRERLQQIDTLLGPEWLGSPDCHGPIVFCGDLNSGPRSPVYHKLAEHLLDVQHAREDGRPEKTFFSRWPLRRIDHIFVSRDWKVGEVRVLRTSLARKASDHLPLVADLRLLASPERQTEVRHASEVRPPTEVQASANRSSLSAHR